MSQNNYIGSGIIFPVELTSTGSAVFRTGVPLINSSLKIILSWPSSGKLFLREFKSIIPDLLEEPNDNLIQRLVEHFAYEVITKWETRIDLLEVSANRRKDDQLDLSVTYRIKTSNLEHTFVFPFYPEIIY